MTGAGIAMFVDDVVVPTGLIVEVLPEECATGFGELQAVRHPNSTKAHAILCTALAFVDPGALVCHGS